MSPNFARRQPFRALTIVVLVTLSLPSACTCTGSVIPGDGGMAGGTGGAGGGTNGGGSGGGTNGGGSGGGTNGGGTGGGATITLANARYVDGTLTAATTMTYDPTTRSATGGTFTAYRTIQACAAAVMAGETCVVMSGTYDEAVTMTRDGTLGAPITFLANGTVTITRAVVLELSDYVRFIGFTFDSNFGVDDPITLHGTVGVELWRNTFRQYNDTAISSFWSQSENPHSTVDRSIIVGNMFFGAYGHDYNHYSVWGNDNVFAYNEMNRSGVDFINFYGNRNRFINNYGYDPATNSALHIDFLQTAANCCGRVGGTDETLLEANFYVGAPGSDVHTWNLETAVDYSGYFLSRRNVMHNVGTGGGSYDYHHFYVVNDTYSDLQLSDPNGDIGLYLARGANQRIYNSIFAETWGSSAGAVFVVDVVPTGFAHDYNLAWDWQTGATLDWRGALAADAHRLLADPLFADHAGDDFHLQMGSPALGSAGAVTTVTVGGANVSTITVGDAGFFRGFNSNVSQYGGNLAAGDLVTIGTQTRRVRSISGNTLTLVTPVTASAGDPVYMGDDATPDRGALPYKASYAVNTSLSYSNGTLTASVADPSIVRHVEFHVDGLPVAVDIDAPYTFDTSAYAPGSTHAVRAIARPLYASKVLAHEASTTITVP